MCNYIIILQIPQQACIARRHCTLPPSSRTAIKLRIRCLAVLKICHYQLAEDQRPAEIRKNAIASTQITERHPENGRHNRGQRKGCDHQGRWIHHLWHHHLVDFRLHLRRLLLCLHASCLPLSTGAPSI